MPGVGSSKLAPCLVGPVPVAEVQEPEPIWASKPAHFSGAKPRQPLAQAIGRRQPKGSSIQR